MRPNKDTYYLDIALSVLKRSNCLKRHYGCVIVKNDEIIATGYNGSPRGQINCCDAGECKRLSSPRNSGMYDECKSVHAEQNALLSSSRHEMIGATLYLACEENVDGTWIEDTSLAVTPCPICRRMIDNSGIIKIVTRKGEIKNERIIEKVY